VTLDTQTMERLREPQVIGEAKKLTPCGSCRCVHYRPRRQWPCYRSTNSGTALLGGRKIHTKNIQEAQITDEHVLYTENTKTTFLVKKNVAQFKKNQLRFSVGLLYGKHTNNPLQLTGSTRCKIYDLANCKRAKIVYNLRFRERCAMYDKHTKILSTTWKIRQKRL
jgi:hypothetical protein